MVLQYLICFSDHKLVVSFSRFGEIRPSEGGEGLMEDFTGEDYKNLHRFSKEDIALVSLKRIRYT